MSKLTIVGAIAGIVIGWICPLELSLIISATGISLLLAFVYEHK